MTHTVTKALDALPGYLREKISCRGVTLSYIIRQDPAPPAIPAQVAGSVTSDAYNSIMEELIDFCPHHEPEFDEDNASVLSIIKEMTKDTSYMSPITSHVRSRNGRAAYFALSQHNMTMPVSRSW